ncbi:MAG: COX15/CtaA family protein [Candidatus Eisenbacteria bacterium]|uniref:COX15/CtaA family protein n=1 Tax=Eiseniibacteriota bacterium TaxID=2212470 RepID=A0A849SPQ1_UNCEI|nr:COX15/CtaA family protein [Candidatus Eisenbacteria bacterium]
MNTQRDFRFAARLSLATAVLMYGLIVLGSVVRTTASGLACPDWPLCHGRLIPPLQFNILIEWFHRLIAALVSLGLVATAAWTYARPAVRARLGVTMAIALVLLPIQILLGALTVWKLLDPGVVGGHLANALLLFAAVSTYALIAHREASGAPEAAADPERRTLFVTATVATFAQAVLGGIVSTNHAALACPDWPTCDGVWFPPLSGIVGMQMTHRYGAYALVALMLVVATRARTAANPALRRGGAQLLGLTLFQVVIGVCNVFLHVPVWLSALHLAVATAMIARALTLTFLSGAAAVARDPRVIAR